MKFNILIFFYVGNFMIVDIILHLGIGMIQKQELNSTCLHSLNTLFYVKKTTYQL